MNEMNVMWLIPIFFLIDNSLSDSIHIVAN